MIDVIDVTKRFGRFTALSGLSLSVHKASIYGLVGFNGAGKTTLLKTIAGIYRPEEGVVRVNAEKMCIRDRPNIAAAALRPVCCAVDS